MEQKIVKEIVTELSKKYNKREILISALIEENIKHGHSIIESESILDEFLNLKI